MLAWLQAAVSSLICKARLLAIALITSAPQKPLLTSKQAIQAAAAPPSPLALQACLQSLPQVVLLAVALSAIGPLRGDSSGGGLEEQGVCTAPAGVVIAALAVAALNVLDKVAQGAVQVGARTKTTPVVDAWAGGVHSPCGRGMC